MSFHTKPFDTILIDFKNDSSYLTKLDPNKQITLNSVSIETKDLISLPTGQCAQITPFSLIDDFITSDYFQHQNVDNSTTELNVLKKSQKARSKQANHARIQLSNPRLLCDYKFANSTQKNQFLLNSESLACLLEQTAVSKLKSRSKVIVFDDFDGVTVSAVSEKLQIQHPHPDLIPCDLIAPCKAIIEQIGNDFNQADLTEMKGKIREFFLNFMKLAAVPHYSEACILTAGNSTASVLKDTLIDCNLLPHRVVHESGARWPAAPVIFHTNLWRFLNQNPDYLDNLGIFSDPNTQKEEFKSEVDQITPENITKMLDIEFVYWLERRMNYYEIEGTILGRVTRTEIVDGKLQNSQIKSVEPIFVYSDFSTEKFAFDSLIIAARSRPLPALKAFLPVLKSGAPVSIFAEALPALEEVGNFVVSGRNGLRFAVMKCHAVQQQILPNRTHPVMIGPLSTGFVGCVDEEFVKGRFNKDIRGRQKKVR